MSWSTTRTTHPDSTTPECGPCLSGCTYSREAVEQIVAETSRLYAYRCPTGQGWHLTIRDEEPKQ
jgi:hypothetical protein